MVVVLSCNNDETELSSASCDKTFINNLGYRDNCNGTVTDTNNNLVWLKCSVGQKNNATCSGTALKFQYCPTYDSSCDNGNILISGPAFDVCNSLNINSSGEIASITTWRNPTLDELKSLVYCSNGTPTPLAGLNWCGQLETFSEPTIDKEMFPNTLTSPYWTSSVANNDHAWGVSFKGGNTIGGYKSSNLYVRCVSSGQ